MSSALRPMSSSSRSLCVIKPTGDQVRRLLSHSIRNTSKASTAFRVALPVVLYGSANKVERLREITVGALHSSQSCMSAPSVEAFVK